MVPVRYIIIATLFVTLGVFSIFYALPAAFAASPDLIVSLIGLDPVNPDAGESVTFDVHMKNQGDSKAVGEFHVSLKIDTNNNGTIDYSDTKKWSTIGVDKTETAFFEDVWTASNGTHKAEACVDIYDDIAESDENNNCTTLVFEVPRYECPLVEDDDTTVIIFPEEPADGFLWVPDYLSLGPVGIDMEKGTYDITLVSWDAHSSHGGQGQQHEQWYVQLADNGETVFESNPIDDLPEEDDYITQTVNTGAIISSDINEITALHVNNPSSANSIKPVCAALTDVGEQTLSVDLRARAPGSSSWQQSLDEEAPLEDVDLKANVSGTAEGTINYTFYCDRSDDGTNITIPWDAKYDGITESEQTVNNLCDYNEPGTYYAKVIVEQGSAPAAEDRVQIVVNEAGNTTPEAVNLSVQEGDRCAAPLQPTLSWVFSDPDPDDGQSAYQIQISESPAFNPLFLVKDTGKVSSISTSYTVPAGTLEFDETYYWRVRVWDMFEAVSDYANGPSFTTLPHASPDVDFSWTPESPSVEEDVQFTSEVQVYGGASIESYAWEFQDGDPASSSEANPISQFLDDGIKSVTLTVTDTDGYECTTQKNLNVSLPVPQYRDIIPDISF